MNIPIEQLLSRKLSAAVIGMICLMQISTGIGATMYTTLSVCITIITVSAIAVQGYLDKTTPKPEVRPDETP